MRTRVLPPAEWSRLAGTELGDVWTLLVERDTTVFVVEDNDTILGCWAVITYRHLEGCWVAPAHRGRGVVFGRLWHAVQDHAKAHGFGTAMTAAVSHEAHTLAEHLGGVKLPGEHFVILLTGRGD